MGRAEWRLRCQAKDNSRGEILRCAQDDNINRGTAAYSWPDLAELQQARRLSVYMRAIRHTSAMMTANKSMFPFIRRALEMRWAEAESAANAPAKTTT